MLQQTACSQFDPLCVDEQQRHQGHAPMYAAAHVCCVRLAYDAAQRNGFHFD